MSIQKQIEAAFLALETFLAQTEWSETEQDAMKLAVMNAILIKRRKKRKVLR